MSSDSRTILRRETLTPNSFRQELGQQIRTHLRDSGHQVIGINQTSLQGPSTPNADWRTIQKEEILANGEVRVRVETTDICLRIENEMGLYETRTGKAVVVKVDVGG